MDMATALAELGVTEASLDPDTRDQLDRDGYAPLPGVLSAEQVTAIRARLAELLVGPAAHCTPTSPAAPTASNSTRRGTSGRKAWRA
jgi:hypothetical protein